jgi:hypothetical protein
MISSLIVIALPYARGCAYLPFEILTLLKAAGKLKARSAEVGIFRCALQVFLDLF